MKTSGILAVAAGAALAAAQLDQIPTCALTCAITALGSTGCSQTDIACICQASSFLTGILGCIQGTCTPSEIEQTLGAAQVLCAGAGVTITVPGSEPTTTAAPEPEPTTTEEELTTAPGLSTTAAPEPEPTTTEEPSYEASTTEVAPTYEATSDVVTLTTTTTLCPSSTEVPTYVPPAQNTTVAVPPPAYTGAAGSIAANAGTVLFGAALAMFFA
ncbi:hypothetical protein TWF481_003665 [Arthrobotrys musiformis]|uniref:CFEM domain-containing protein n=1 Tax=Arthrobotrys musiformis TaxID=47236 RepID=A0AAV9WIT9_9PEZI